MKILNINISDEFYPDTTGRKGWEEVCILADVLVEDKLFIINIGNILALHNKYEFYIWGDARQDWNYTKITKSQSDIAYVDYYEYLKSVYTIENVTKEHDRLLEETVNMIDNSIYDKQFETKQNIEKQIEYLQKKLTYFN